MSERSMSRSNARTLGISTLCWRNLHTQCLAPESCTCECHEKDRKQESAREADPAPRPLASVPREPEPAAPATAMAKPAAVLVWEEPPPRGRTLIAVPTKAQLVELDAHPGQWARLHSWPRKSTANRARVKAMGRLDGERYQFRACHVDEGSALFGRRIEGS